MINSKVFKSLDRKYGKMLKLKTDIDILVQANKDNPILSQYIDLINQLQKLEKDISNLKANDLYEEFLSNNEKCLTGKYCVAKFVKPYKKLYMDIGKFTKDYGPNTRLYKKYVNEMDIKGRVTITDIKE